MLDELQRQRLCEEGTQPRELGTRTEVKYRKKVSTLDLLEPQCESVIVPPLPSLPAIGHPTGTRRASVFMFF